MPSLAFRQKALPEVPLAASELQKELVSTKGTPPAFALPEFSLLLGRGSFVLAKNHSLAGSLLSGVGKILVSPPGSGIPGPPISAGRGVVSNL